MMLEDPVDAQFPNFFHVLSLCIFFACSAIICGRKGKNSGEDGESVMNMDTLTGTKTNTIDDNSDMGGKSGRSRSTVNEILPNGLPPGNGDKSSKSAKSTEKPQASGAKDDKANEKPKSVVEESKPKDNSSSKPNKEKAAPSDKPAETPTVFKNSKSVISKVDKAGSAERTAVELKG